MKNEIKISYEEFDNLSDLPEEDYVLLLQACYQSDRAYSPYSNFSVGSAVLLNNGDTYFGFNQENMAFSPTICAERVAMFTASVASKSPIKSEQFTVNPVNL